MSQTVRKQLTNRIWRINNVEKCRVYTRKWRLANPEKVSAKAKINRENLDPWVKTFYEVNKRCNQPSFKSFSYYGGRGIKSLMKRQDFEHLWFRDNADLMDKPSIDRIDSDGNYELSNCRYIEMSENIARGNRKKIGELNPKSVTTTDTVRAIRNEYIPNVVTSKMLASKYKLNQHTIDSILYKRDKCWRTVC